MAGSAFSTDHAGDSQTRFWEKISLIAEISSACRRLNPKAPVFNEVLSLIQVIIPFDAASLYLRESKSDQYLLKASIQEEVPVPESFAVRDGIPSDTSPPIINGPQLWYPDSRGIHSGVSRGGFAALLLAPLCIDNETIGLLNLASYARGVLSEKQIKLVTVIADQLAISLERLEYVARIEAQHHTLQQSHDRLRADQARLVAEEKLAAVAELARTINHQINNPLSVIVGNVECLALEEARLSARSKDRLKRIVEAALKVGEMNRRLLNIQALLGDPSLSASKTENPASAVTG